MFQLVDGNMMITGSSRATGKMENPHEEKDLRGQRRTAARSGGNEQVIDNG